MLSADEAANLIEAIAARQDRTAFASLFRHFGPRIRAFLMRGGADAEAAQEAAQEAMILVWRKAASFDRSRASAATWIYTIARNMGTSVAMIEQYYGKAATPQTRARRLGGELGQYQTAQAETVPVLTQEQKAARAAQQRERRAARRALANQIGRAHV